MKTTNERFGSYLHMAGKAYVLPYEPMAHWMFVTGDIPVFVRDYAGYLRVANVVLRSAKDWFVSGLYRGEPFFFVPRRSLVGHVDIVGLQQPGGPASFTLEKDYPGSGWLAIIEHETRIGQQTSRIARSERGQ